MKSFQLLPKNGKTLFLRANTDKSLQSLKTQTVSSQLRAVLLPTLCGPTWVRPLDAVHTCH